MLIANTECNKPGDEPRTYWPPKLNPWLWLFVLVLVVLLTMNLYEMVR